MELARGPVTVPNDEAISPREPVSRATGKLSEQDAPGHDSCHGSSKGHGL